MCCVVEAVVGVVFVGLVDIVMVLTLMDVIGFVADLVVLLVV